MKGQIGIIGFGMMGEALGRCLLGRLEGLPGLGQGSLSAGPPGAACPPAGGLAGGLICWDIDPARLKAAISLGARPAKSSRELARESAVIIIAVKPADVETVLREIRPELSADKTLISIAAGIPCSKLSEWASQEGAEGPAQRPQLIRAMPNILAAVGEASIALASDSPSTSEALDAAEELLSAAGRVVRVPERLLDAVTGLSGSGPAYVFLMIEAMADAGVAQGLPRKSALSLAAQTFLGAAKMVLQGEKHPAQLRDMVTSPGGTTIAGLRVLESRAVRAALIEAVTAAALRARELAEKK
jgi:pyrroline-5-carboxylate reductase